MNQADAAEYAKRLFKEWITSFRSRLSDQPLFVNIEHRANVLIDPDQQESINTAFLATVQSSIKVSLDGIWCSSHKVSKLPMVGYVLDTGGRPQLMLWVSAEHRSHKLQSLIERHNFEVTARHRAFEDAQVLWQFIQLIQEKFDPELLTTAIAKQVKKPSLPKGLDPEILANLPDTHGVYIFEDSDGNPLYVGKSVNIKKRVASHFAADHEHVGEFRMAQSVRNITAHVTSGELSALLLESELIKQLMPMHNKMLRRTSKLILAKQSVNEDGYIGVQLQEAFGIEPEDVADVLAIYTRRSQAKQSLDTMVKDWNLCPKLLGLEKPKGSCFLYQLHRCDGACIGAEPAESYNSRLAAAFERLRIEAWPYNGPIILAERPAEEANEEPSTSIIVDQWCVLAHVSQDPYSEPVIKSRPKVFDLDTYKILRSYITRKLSHLTITPVTYDQLAGLR